MNEMRLVQSTLDLPPSSACDAIPSSAVAQLSGEELERKWKIAAGRVMMWRRQFVIGARWHPEFTAEEMSQYFLNRRRGEPLFQIPNPEWFKGAGFFYCIVCALRNYQIGKARDHLRFTKRPDAKAIHRARNFTPASIAARKKSNADIRADPVRLKRNREQKAQHYYNNHEHYLTTRAKKREVKRLTQTDVEREEERKYFREWHGEKRRTVPHYNIRNRLCSRLWHAVAGQGGKKAYKTEELIGCTVDELRLHLERHFKEGMTWDKFLNGEIHIDHKLPCAAFDLTDPDQQKLCFHWTNLFPEWAAVNHSKSDRLPDGTRARDLKKLRSLNTPSEVLSKGA